MTHDLKLWVGQACEDEHTRLMALYDVSPKVLSRIKRQLGIDKPAKRKRPQTRLCSNCQQQLTA